MTGATWRTRPRPGVFAVCALACVVAFCVLGSLVLLGQLAAVDGYAVRHLMPFRSNDQGGSSPLGTLLSYHDFRFHPGRILRLPASALLSTVLVALVCLGLWWRGRRRLALLWGAAFAVGNIVELGSKLVVTKPLFYIVSQGETMPVGFRHSFPSGHVLRGVLLVAAAMALWPSLRLLFLIWAVAVVVTLELDGIHTPSDLAGGLLLAAALILGVLAVESEVLDASLVRTRLRVRQWT
jgi:membrane-associated phospholipid phosphatase